MIFKHQEDIIKEDKLYSGIFLGTGSGKTFIALSLAVGKTLVICPKTQKEDQNWERELKRMGKKLNLTVISKETFRRDFASLPRYDTVICDEAHTMLGVTPNTRQRKKVIIPRTSQIYEAIRDYLVLNKPSRVYLLTATIMKSPMTVWGAAQLLGYNWDFFSFREAFYIRLPMPGRDVYAPNTSDSTKERLARLVKKIGYTGRLQDYFDVPEQSYKTIHIEPTKEQLKRIGEMKLEYPEPIVRVGKIHQVEQGMLSGDTFNESEAIDNNKIDVIIDLMEEFPKMIVFCKYRMQIAQLVTAINKKNARTVAVLQGDTPNRGEIFKSLLTYDEYVLICQSQISAGWELPDCPVMVFASMDYSFVNRTQAEGRILRANHLKKNLYIDLITRYKGSVDEAVQKCIVSKQDFDERLYANI